MGNDHIARPYTQSKKIQCLKQQMLLAQLQEVGIQLSKDQLEILADTGERIDSGPGDFTVTTNALFQADGVEVYDSDCDDVPNAQPSFMANISSYGSDALAEVHNPDNVDNNMINQGVQYVIESQQAVVQNSNSSTQQDALILFVIEQLKSQVINCTKINLDNKSVNDTLTGELERYKEQVRVLTEGQNVDLKSFQNPFYLKKAQQLKPKLYYGNVIKNTSAIVIPDSEETLMLAEESQEKDTVIKKLKERIKSLSGNMNEDKIKKDIEEIETINIELDHRVSKLIAKNEHLKQTYKQLYDSIKPTRIRSKEQCDALIAQINAKFVENSDLNAQLQEKVFAITALKEELRKLKGKSVIACRESMNKPKVIAPVVHKVDLEPLSPKLKNDREAHVDYIRITKENADTLRDVVEQAELKISLDNALAS
ncbi:hypothetical protein Tco_0994186 [Tanacetum coccineum]